MDKPGVPELAKAFAALSSPERLAIVGLLLTEEGPHCGEIARALGMSTSALSYHLRTLEEAGLVRRTRQGRRHCISVTPLVAQLLRAGILGKLKKEGKRWTIR
ncbi:helix-turn-helix transcriptional regulator [Candidatus Bipolaricaulota bacterium]|nr:helix-turn-helix transcriptional regulator [Candidatus Bipolaricaulota bacterium]